MLERIPPLSPEEKDKIRDFVQATAAELEIEAFKVIHVNDWGLTGHLSIVCFHETEATFDSHFQSGKLEKLREVLVPQLHPHFEFLADWETMLSFASLELVDNIGGWYYFYK